MVGQGRKVGGNFPTFGSIRWKEKKMRKAKKKKGGKSNIGEKEEERG